MLMKTTDIYHEISPQQESTPTITGRALAHTKRTTAESAFGAAAFHRNRIQLINPTIGQTAMLWGVCRPYVTAATVIANNPAARTAVLAGKITLLEAAKAAKAETLAEHFARTTPTEWLEAARVIGPAAIWDHMISPLV